MAITLGRVGTAEEAFKWIQAQQSATTPKVAPTPSKEPPADQKAPAKPRA